MSDDLIERLRHCISDLTTAQKRAEQAERALAEAVKVINRQTNNALAAADLLADGAHRIDVTQDEWREHAAATEAARAFVAQHGSDSGKERK